MTILYLELLVELLNIVFQSLGKLCLVLSDGPADASPHKEGIVPREDPEHFVGGLGRPELVSQPCSDPGLHSVGSLIVSFQSCLPRGTPLRRQVEAVHDFDVFVCQLDFPHG